MTPRKPRNPLPPLFGSGIHSMRQKPTDGVRGSHAQRAWASYAAAHPSPKLHHRGRGSVLILVVVVLVLIALLGAAWLSFARTQRVAIHGTESSNIDLVMAATVSYISDVLRDDLFNDDGHLFDGATDEAMDYAFTDETVTFTVSDLDGADIGDAEGGTLDDTWLASTRPDFSGANTVWPQITNLNGIYLRLPGDTGGSQPTAGSNTQLPTVTGDGATTVQSWRFTRDVRLDASSSPAGLDNGDGTGTHSKLGTDADGDGILDSKWTWAPLPQQAGVRYVMAVRIIDNSALLNADVALPMGFWDPSGTPVFDYSTVNTEPRAWFPTDLGLGRFIALHNGSTSKGTGAFQSELTDLVRHRMTATTNNPVLFNPGGTSQERVNYWLQGARFYGEDVGSSIGGTLADYIDDRLPANDEIELRHRNGLNSTTGADIEDATFGMPTLLRAGDTENTYTDVAGVATIEDYFTLNPRLMLTTRSGASVYAPRLPGETGTDNAVPVRTDLNNTLGAIQTALTNAVDGLTLANLLPPGLSALNDSDFVNQFTANIQDYIDNDGILTQVGNRYGMEPLPFISEVYTQARYEATGVVTPDGTDEVTNIELEGRVGWAIEIRNPFNVSVNLADAELWIDGNLLGTSTLAAIPGVPATLRPNEILILWRRSNVDGAGAEDDFSSPLFAGPETFDGTNAYTHRVVEITDAMVGATNPILPIKNDNAGLWDTDTLEVQLRCQTRAFTAPNTFGPATFVNWPYQTFPIETYPQTVERRQLAATTPTLATQYPGTAVFYAQTAYASVANRINLLELDGTQIQSLGRNTPGDPMPLAPASKHTAPTADYIAIGTAVKDTDGGLANVPASFADDPNVDAKFNPATSQVIFSTDAPDNLFRFAWELAYITILGPSDTQTVAQAIGGNDKLTDFQLSFGLPGDDSGTDTAGGGDNAVPDALLLIERFTTLDPRADLVDNDGDGTVDEADELLVPGTINLNTVTPEVLAHILPYPVPDADHLAIADAILEYRDNPANRGTAAEAISGISGYRGRAGIAHLGELAYLLDSGGGSGTDVLVGESISADGIDNDTVPDENANDVPVDYNTGEAFTVGTPTRPEYEVPDAENQADIGIIDDREEQVEFMKRLAQVASVRSDVYTAYVVIRGYPAEDFRQGPVESAQFMVIYSRANLADADDEVEVLGYFVLSKN